MRAAGPRLTDARAGATADAPQAADVTGWLDANLPPGSRRAALIHNDYKLDNVVFDPSAPAHLIGVLDWEMATVGDPLMDVCCSLAYWIEAGDAAEMQATRMLPTQSPGSSRANLMRYCRRAAFRWAISAFTAFSDCFDSP
jgi:aminoglycoside phosphotransferase (APT) family kinase protein